MHAGQSLMDVRLSQKSIKNMCKAVSPCDFFFVLFLISIQTQKALSQSHVLLNLTPDLVLCKAKTFYPS